MAGKVIDFHFGKKKIGLIVSHTRRCHSAVSHLGIKTNFSRLQMICRAGRGTTYLPFQSLMILLIQAENIYHLLLFKMCASIKSTFRVYALSSSFVDLLVITDMHDNTKCNQI